MASFTVTRFQGDTYPIIINIRRGNAPFDLTGSVITLSVGKHVPPKQGDVVETMVATSVDNSSATFVITANIANLATGDYFGELEITDTNNYIWTPAQFSWKIKPTLT